MQLYGFYAWLFLVLVSFITELHTQYGPVTERYNQQRIWLRDCAKPDHYRDYKSECNYHTGQHYPHWVFQYSTAVIQNIKWCGVDRCESLFTLKGVAVSVVVATLLKGVPKIRKEVLRKITNE
jgi:hypothetical protein